MNDAKKVKNYLLNRKTLYMKAHVNDIKIKNISKFVKYKIVLHAKLLSLLSEKRVIM